RDQLARRDETTMDLVAAFHLDGVRDLVRTLVGNRDRIEFDPWLNRTPEEVVEIWADYVRTHLVPQATERIAGSPLAAKLLKLLRDNEAKNNRMIERRAYILEHLPKLAESDDLPKALAELREHCTTQHGGAAKGWHNPDDYTAINEAIKALRAEIDSALKLLDFNK